jgi:hypothetical protein
MQLKSIAYPPGGFCYEFFMARGGANPELLAAYMDILSHGSMNEKVGVKNSTAVVAIK